MYACKKLGKFLATLLPELLFDFFFRPFDDLFALLSDDLRGRLDHGALNVRVGDFLFLLLSHGVISSNSLIRFPVLVSRGM